MLRTARPRHYLMCRPTHFDVTYSINPWMRPEKSTEPGIAVTQWERLRRTLTGLGHQVELIDPLPGLPDMVFAANGATMIDGTVLSAKFRHEQRAPEGPAYAEWFAARGYRVHHAEFVNEGEGDYLFTGKRLLAGTGFRTVLRSHEEAAELFGHEVVGLTLVNPRFYHLDTALAILDDDEIMYYPAAFSAGSRARLAELYPDAVIATDHDAEVFGLNAVSDGRNVVMAEQARGLAAQLRERGYVPVGVELSELLKSGGSAKCCTLELRSVEAAS
ncbi:dimethylargininase [Streptomyces fagopyri]|uniref:dimethylargininase n=1 Tax=Streptomyces fagopyri TaxID=2662397 RepID=UPI0037FCBE3A